MAIIFKPHKYQTTAIQHVEDNLRAGLILDMGLGKTVSTLTAFKNLLDRFEVSKMLVIAPKLVATHTWPAEIQKWEHLKGLRVKAIKGSAAQRAKALTADADIYTIGRENTAWLVETLGRGGWDFDMLVVDELSSFKNPASQRFKALKKVAYLSSRCVGLTGTPAPNGLIDLWAQIYLLDKGERLGKNITAYRQAYFFKDFSGFGFCLNPKYKDLIYSKIADICISMTAKDYLDLPERLDVVREVPLVNLDGYRKFAKQEVLRLDSGGEITPLNAAALYSKLLQYANGAVYDADKNTHFVDDSKLDMLEEMVEELQGKPVIVFYSFKSDKERIMARIKNSEAVDKKDGPGTVDRWNRGEIPVLVANPASIGHGLNMQFGGHHIIWFGLTNNLELYLQAVKRLDRQGQVDKVINTLLLAKGTIEEAVWERLKGKDATQNALIEALKAHLF